MGLFSRLFPRYQPLTAESEARSMMEIQIDQLSRRQTTLIAVIASAEEELTGVNEVLSALRSAVDACNPNLRTITRHLEEALDADFLLEGRSESPENGTENSPTATSGGDQVPSFLREGLR